MSMRSGQMLGMMFIVGLVLAIVFGVLYLLIGGLEGPFTSGMRPEVAGYLQECAASASDCALVRLGEFGGGMASSDAGFDATSSHAGKYLARNSLDCVKGRANLSSESQGSASFNQEDSTTLLVVSSGYQSGSEEGRFEKFSSSVDARYRHVRGLELSERNAPGRLSEGDVNLDFISDVEGKVVVYEG